MWFLHALSIKRPCLASSYVWRLRPNCFLTASSIVSSSLVSYTVLWVALPLSSSHYFINSKFYKHTSYNTFQIINTICFPGVYLHLGPKEVEPFIKSQLSELINSKLKDKGVVWHASYVRTLSKVQLVLMEQEEYSEELSGVAQELRESLIKSKYRT